MMKNLINIFKPILILLSISLLFSCSKDDGIELPQTGENSFTTEINGQTFIPENVERFLNTSYGISAYEYEKTWHLKLSNSSNNDLHIYLKDINLPGKYKIEKLDNDLNFYTPTDINSSIGISDGTGSVYGVAYSSNTDYDQYVEITQIKGDSILIGEFNGIILENPDNQTDQVILTNGKFNINRNTLNREDYDQ